MEDSEKDYLVTIEHNHPDTPDRTYYTRGKIRAKDAESAETRSKPWVRRKMAQGHCICFRENPCSAKIEEMPEELKPIEHMLENFEIIS